MPHNVHHAERQKCECRPQIFEHEPAIEKGMGVSYTSSHHPTGSQLSYVQLFINNIIHLLFSHVHHVDCVHKLQCTHRVHIGVE